MPITTKEELMELQESLPEEMVLSPNLYDFMNTTYMDLECPIIKALRRETQNLFDNIMLSACSVNIYYSGINFLEAIYEIQEIRINNKAYFNYSIMCYLLMHQALLEDFSAVVTVRIRKLIP